MCVRKRYYHRREGCRIQLSLHTSLRTELVPRRNRASLGVAGKRKGYMTGPPRLPFSFPIIRKFQQQQQQQKICRFEVWKSHWEVEHIFDLYSLQKEILDNKSILILRAFKFNVKCVVPFG